MKLTAKIAASYFGAEVRCAPYGGPPDRKIIGTMIGLNNDGIHVKFPEWQSHQHQVAIGVCQLILTPLDKISDEDAVEVAKIADKNVEYKKGNGHIAEITRYKVVKSESKDKSYIGIDRYSGDTYYGYDPLPITASLYSIEQIDYLRSKGYDCGHGSIPNLIAAGVAVEKEIV